MSIPNLDELDESIELLVNYRDRLQEEVISISKKLQMPPAKISSKLKENSELNNINKTIRKLKYQREKCINRKDIKNNT